MTLKKNMLAIEKLKRHHISNNIFYQKTNNKNKKNITMLDMSINTNHGSN